MVKERKKNQDQDEECEQIKVEYNKYTEKFYFIFILIRRLKQGFRKLQRWSNKTLSGTKKGPIKLIGMRSSVHAFETRHPNKKKKKNRKISYY